MVASLFCKDFNFKFLGNVAIVLEISLRDLREYLHVIMLFKAPNPM